MDKYQVDKCDVSLETSSHHDANFVINPLRPRQHGRHFPDNIFKCIFLNENVWIAIEISLKFVPKGDINNIPALVQIMAWRRLGDKPLSEPMMVRLPTHICVIRPQWVNADSVGCHYNNFQCHQWWQSWFHDNYVFSVIIQHNTWNEMTIK